MLSELLLNEGFQWIGVFDDNPLNFDLNSSIQYLGKYDSTIYPDLPLLIAIGNNKIRAEISNKVAHSFLTYIHPSAFISKSAKIAEGTVIMQNVIVQANVSVAKHCIINAQTTIDHDTQIADFVHVGALSYIGSNSQVSTSLELAPGSIFPRFSSI